MLGRIDDLLPLTAKRALLLRDATPPATARPLIGKNVSVLNEVLGRLGRADEPEGNRKGILAIPCLIDRKLNACRRTGVSHPLILIWKAACLNAIDAKFLKNATSKVLDRFLIGFDVNARIVHTRSPNA